MRNVTAFVEVDLFVMETLEPIQFIFGSIDYMCNTTPHAKIVGC